jgi:hypothetical protein
LHNIVRQPAFRQTDEAILVPASNRLNQAFAADAVNTQERGLVAAPFGPGWDNDIVGKQINHPATHALKMPHHAAL